METDRTNPYQVQDIAEQREDGQTIVQNGGNIGFYNQSAVISTRSRSLKRPKYLVENRLGLNSLD